MLLQTNSYIVPKEKRAEHARLLRRFRQVLARLGCDNFEVYEQVGANWNTAEISGRVVQIMRFRDRRHQLAVQAAERNDPVAQAVIAEFCQLINFPYQQQQGLFAVGFYNNLLPVATARLPEAQDAQGVAEAAAAQAPPAAEGPGPGAPAEEILPGDHVLTPDPRRPDPLFAEGTEGIIAAAERLTDDELDAGGDAAVDDAIANASAENAGQAAALVEGPALLPGPSSPVEGNGHHGGPTSSASPQAAEEDLDLTALLDPHLRDDSGDAHAANGTPRDQWDHSLSLEGVLDDESAIDESAADERATPDSLLGSEPEEARDRNHVSQ